MSVRDPTYEIEPDILIRMVSKEYNWVIRETSVQTGQTYQCSEKREEGDVALAAAPVQQGGKAPRCSYCLLELWSARHVRNILMSA